MKADISIVIVNYNTKEYLLNCINSIFSSNCKSDFEIIIIDNNSSDDSIQLLDFNKDNIRIVRNNKNLGFSKAVNIGLKMCLGRYVCILNPDTIVKYNCFNKLLQYMESNKDVFCVSPKIVNSDGSLQISCKRSLPKIKDSFFKITGIDKILSNIKFFSHYNLLYLDENKSHQVEVISGACMFLKREVIDLVGYFDESFFMYGEDIDYCHRIADLNMKIIYFPDCEVIHFKGISAQSRAYEVISDFHDSMIKYVYKYQHRYISWRFFKLFIASIIIIKKYLSYFIHLSRNKVK